MLQRICPKHRDILIEATSSQKVWETSVSTGDQGGAPTLSHGPSVTEIEMKLTFFK